MDEADGWSFLSGLSPSDNLEVPAMSQSHSLHLLNFVLVAFGPQRAEWSPSPFPLSLLTPF